MKGSTPRATDHPGTAGQKNELRRAQRVTEEKETSTTKDPKEGKRTSTTKDTKDHEGRPRDRRGLTEENKNINHQGHQVSLRKTNPRGEETINHQGPLRNGESGIIAGCDECHNRA